MNTANADQEPGKKDTAWVFLAEYFLDEFRQLDDGRDQPAGGIRFKDPGLSQECLNQMDQVLVEFAQQAVANDHPGTPAVIRLYCQEKMLKNGNLAETMCLRPIFASPGTVLRAESKMSGGWGYFLVEKSAGSCASSSGSPRYHIDLFLYKEGV